MIDPAIPPLIDDMTERLRVAYGVPASTLHDQFHKIGRQLPPKLQRSARVMAEAEQFMGNPKLARRVQVEKVQRAHEDLLPHLAKQDLDYKRKGLVISTVLTMLVNLLILAVLVGVVLWMVDRV
ncbi:MAG: hypothetical protein ACPG5U_08635 [Planktomarina sp.]